ELPRNLILSQEWRMNTRAIPSLPIPKKPVTYQPPTQMSIKQDKPKLNTTENNNNNHDTSLNGTSSHGITALVSAFNKSSENNTGNGERSSRSSSVTSAQPIVQNLVKIYTEASTTPKQQHKQRDDSVVSTGKHDELTKIFEQAASRSQRQQQQTASTSIIKQPSRGYEEAYEEITWDSLVHGTTPVAPPFPDQWQTATENHHHPPKAPERPISATS
ncbi:unnamed protein product, partial [Adineta steineri]